MSSSSISMSKEKLKSELQSRNIPLPPTGSKKEVYVQLYEKYLTNTHNAEPRASEFSSDEEEAYKYTKDHIKEKSIFTSYSENNDMTPTIVLDGIRVNITELSDDELRQYLIKYNVAVGPIVETTRTVYERKLARLLNGDLEGDVQNGQHNQDQDEYSDSDQEEILEPFITPVFNSNSPRKKKHEDSPKPVIYNVIEPEPAVSRRNVSRDTPAVRRSLRDNISYTPIDRSLYGDLMRKQNEEALSKLASKVVENTPEPVKEKKRSNNLSMMKKLIFIILLMVIISVIVYCNMEASNTDEIKHLPSSV